ncbi:CDK5 regulatory subunit-associated protein 3-like [Actinia tenebrosa]|uniref:CDK5 regulatory subunit-associated protein 3-like n=1 Tax=Actinia tenebrosa TaxID=6105 RepID=A0A6P8HP18_ACTTE|nr:CDK5 regulatory subunit-associated protein 3-like [Actinia tenebrosa]
MQQNGGKQVEEELLPIDIYYNKLLDWLLDRRHCDLKWQNDALEIREKINAAIQDMPPVDEITELLSGSFINYFHCLRIVELLKVSESATKNIFGRYSSKRMKDWQEIVSLYEKNNLYLAEAAHLLIRNVNFEVPSLKRQIGKCQQTQRDCTKKENEYSSNASVFLDQHKKTCEKMGIKGDNIKSELMDLLKELPEIYSKVAQDTIKCSNIVEYYQAFTKFVSPSYESSDENQNAQVLPLLRYLIEHGNTTVYQWRTGQVPTAIESDETAEVEVEKSSEGEIDWGEPSADSTVEGTESPSNGIDFGDTGDAIDWGGGGDSGDGTENGGIDWGDSGNDDSAGIDWGDSGITVDESAVTEITVEDSGEGGIAKGKDALTILDNTETRNMFLDEMMELQAFLSQRQAEWKSGSDVVAVNEFQAAPRIIQIQSRETIEKMAATITDVLSRLTTMRVQNLCLLKSSPRYVDRLAESLQQKLRLSEKLKTSCKRMVEKRNEAAEQQRELEPKLEVIRCKTKELKTQIAGEISKKYKNRPVNIMGEINNI